MRPCDRVAAAAGCRIETFGRGRTGTTGWRPTCEGHGGRYGFDLVHHGRKLGRVELSVFGRHNVFECLGRCRPGGRACGCAARKKSSRTFAISRFAPPLGAAGNGGRGRFLGRLRPPPHGNLHYLANHSRSLLPSARVCCLFQPHQALRTARLLDELALSLQNAERVLIADIFRAREGPPQPGEITAADLAARTRALGQDVPGLHAPVDIQQFLQTQLTPGDVLVVMGAGDIGRIGYGLMDWFREHRAAG